MTLTEYFRKKPEPEILPLVPGVWHTDYALGIPRIEWEFGLKKMGIKLGGIVNDFAYFTPNGLREFADFLNALADQEDGK